METYANRHAQIADLSTAGKLVAPALRTFNDPMKARNLMKTLLCLCAVALLAACSSMPAGSQHSEVRHPDAFHSYID